jgi:signal transduction histidine kinase
MAKLARGGEELPAAEVVSVADLATDVARLLQPQLKAAGVEIELNIDPETPKISAIRSQLHQVILNLLMNALHASSEEGRIRLTVAPNSEGAPEGIGITVADDGSGIPEEDLERIFNPFFTTKDPDQGTGLGLMISHQIVADHGGEIEVRSRLGEGSSFHVSLPCSEHRASRSDPTPS